MSWIISSVCDLQAARLTPEILLILFAAINGFMKVVLSKVLF